MPTIILKTLINAPIGQCFDLSRSIDLHVQSMQHSGEQAIAGKVSGVINLGESVTWRAKHFGRYFEMTNKITAMEYLNSFADEMIKGPFKKLHHQHLFKTIGTQTEMTDIFEFKAPLGILGWLAEKLFLTRYMNLLLVERNEVIKREAEGDKRRAESLKTKNQHFFQPYKTFKWAFRQKWPAVPHLNCHPISL